MGIFLCMNQFYTAAGDGGGGLFSASKMSTRLLKFFFLYTRKTPKVQPGSCIVIAVIASDLVNVSITFEKRCYVLTYNKNNISSLIIDISNQWSNGRGDTSEDRRRRFWKLPVVTS